MACRCILGLTASAELLVVLESGGLVLPPDGGREPELAGTFGKARLMENSPL